MRWAAPLRLPHERVAEFLCTKLRIPAPSCVLQGRFAACSKQGGALRREGLGILIAQSPMFAVVNDRMWNYAVRRIMLAIPIAIGVTIICFCLVYLAPGDPVQNLLPPDASQSDVTYLKHAYGLDQPVPVQYFKWL